MRTEFEDRLRGSETRCSELLRLGDELREERQMKQSQSASRRDQPLQTSGSRPTRATRQQALAPSHDPTTRISRPSSASSHRSRQPQTHPSMTRVLELETQQWANVRPAQPPLHSVPEDSLDASAPPVAMDTPFVPTIEDLASVDLIFLGEGDVEVDVRGKCAPSLEHSLVSPLLADAMGKSGITPRLPLPAHGMGEMTQMTVRVPVATSDGQCRRKDLEILAKVDDRVKKVNYILGWRALNKIKSGQYGHTMSTPGGAQTFGLAGGHVGAAAINMNSPPPTSGYTSYDQLSMNPAMAQSLPISPYNFGHDMSGLDGSTVDGFMGGTEMYPNAPTGAQVAPMPVSTGWPSNRTFYPHSLDTQSATVVNPMVSGTEAAGATGHQGRPDLVTYQGQIRFWDGTVPPWGSRPS